MKKATAQGKKVRNRRIVAQQKLGRKKVVAARSLIVSTDEKDQPIRCASPPCYMPEIEE